MPRTKTPASGPTTNTAVLPLRTTGDGVVVPVRVIPRSSRTQLAGMRVGRLLVRLSAPPVEGAANQGLVKLMAKCLGVPQRAVRIVSGARARQKSVLIEGLTAEEILDRLIKLT